MTNKAKTRKTTTKRRSGKGKARARRDIFQEVTTRIVAALEAGTVPWRKPWVSSDWPTRWPTNLRSGKRYRGVNVFLLAMSGFGCPYWMTYRQAEEMGGHVRKGESGTLVVFWKWYDKKGGGGVDENGEPVDARIPVLKHYTVFNAEQIEGIDAKLPERGELPDADAFDPVEECEEIVQSVRDREDGPKVENHRGSGRAFYRPETDEISLPAPEQFDTPSDYYGTAFHEITHATGHASRLNRLEPATFGSDTYGREELVAEMGSAFLCAEGGILQDTFEQSAAYLSGWISTIRGNPKLIVQAAAQAQRAVDWVLGTEFDADGDESSENATSEATSETAAAV